MIATGLRLDLGCGTKVKAGFQGVDVEPLSGVLCVDLLRFPWPWPDASVEEVACSHFFEHIPAKLRPVFMDELWRILSPEGVAVITVPKWDSPGAVQDFTHEWPPVAPQSFLYFNRDARRLMGLEHYPCTCHFDMKVREFVEYIPQTEVRLVKLPVKLFVFSDGVRHGCYVYREEVPLEALERRGHTVEGGLVTKPLDDGSLADVDLFIMPRFLFGDYPLVVDEIQRNGRALVYEIDDAADLFERYHTSYFQVRNSLPSYYYMIQQADLVTTTTEHLAQHLRSLGARRVEVLPNCPPPSVPWVDPPHNTKVRIGYTGWTAHMLDAAFWLDCMAVLREMRQDFTPVLFGIANTSDVDGDMFFDRCKQAIEHNPVPNEDFKGALKVFRKAWLPLKDVLEWRHMVPVDDYWTTLADLKLDIGCAPLLDTPFNRCKSAVKFYDYAVSGAVTLASDVLPYSAEPMIHVPNGLSAWVKMLSILIDHRQYRLRLLQEQRAWIREHRNPDTWAVTREAVYRSLLPAVAEAVA